MVAIARYYQRAKNGIHALQALIIFLGAVITIAIYAKSGQSDGRINYYFALCWLCIPALVYQSAFPIFERTKRFANAYAHAAIDLLYTILWFAAFIAVLVWVRQGSHAAKGWDSKDSLCDKFAWGPTSKCKLGKASGALGVIIWLLFILTTALSIYGLLYFRRTGFLPAYQIRAPEVVLEEDQEDYTFSSNPHDKLDEREELQAGDHEREELQPMHHERDEVSSLHTFSDSGAHDRTLSFEREPSPELPMHQHRTISWDRLPTPEEPIRPHQASPPIWDRQRTPELPVGEGYYPVDTSYHGSSQIPNSTSQQNQISGLLGARTPSPLYDAMHSGERNFLGAQKPVPQQNGVSPVGNERMMSQRYGGYRDESRIDFPDADYHR